MKFKSTIISFILVILINTLFFSVSSSAKEKISNPITIKPISSEPIELDQNDAFIDPISGLLITPFKVSDNELTVMSEEDYLRELEKYPREELVGINNNDSEEVYSPMDNREYWTFTPSSTTVVTGDWIKINNEMLCTTCTCRTDTGQQFTVSNSFNVSLTAEKSAIKANAGYTWVESKNKINIYSFTLSQGDRGFIGFYPRYKKTTGSLNLYSNWDGLLSTKTGIAYSVQLLNDDYKVAEPEGMIFFLHILVWSFC